MNLTNTIKYLRDKEWTMGNGQCHDCCGNAPGKWAPHPCCETPEEEGHQPDCKLAKSLVELGETVIYAKLTDEMKREKAKQATMEFYVETMLGIKAPEGSIARKIQEKIWKTCPPIELEKSNGNA